MLKILNLFAPLISLPLAASLQGQMTSRGSRPRVRGVRMTNVTRGRWTGSRKLNRMGRVD